MKMIVFMYDYFNKQNLFDFIVQLEELYLLI